MVKWDILYEISISNDKKLNIKKSYLVGVYSENNTHFFSKNYKKWENEDVPFIINEENYELLEKYGSFTNIFEKDFQKFEKNWFLIRWLSYYLIDKERISDLISYLDKMADNEIEKLNENYLKNKEGISLFKENLKNFECDKI